VLRKFIRRRVAAYLNRKAAEVETTCTSSWHECPPGTLSFEKWRFAAKLRVLAERIDA
jgi:hypothetical protein